MKTKTSFKNKPSKLQKNFKSKSKQNHGIKKNKTKFNEKSSIIRDSGSKRDMVSSDDGPVFQEVNSKRLDYLDDDSSSIDSDEEFYSSTSHKDTLNNLKDKDPEFYEYLQKHDKSLLEFDDEKIEDEEVDYDFGQLDEKEEEPESVQINLNNVKAWKNILQNPTGKTNCLVAIKSIIRAFRQTVLQSNPSEKSDEHKPINVMNPDLFNLIINTCLVDLLPALMHYLRINKSISNDNPELPNGGGTFQNYSIVDPRSSRNWKRVMPLLKMYLTDVIKMTDSLSAEARVSFERHVFELVPFFNTFPHLLKRITKRSIQEWYSSDSERSRVLAFLILYRIIRAIQHNSHLTKSEQQTLINHVLRRMYLAFAIASKTTNEMTIEKIAFLRNSLVELYNLDHSVAYQQAFIFTRQLAINLRKAIMLNEKDSLKRVYNWQYVHSIELWAQLIGATMKRNETDLQLLSPITNIGMETLRAFYAFKYVPFRLHIINSLNKLVAEVGCFVPVLKTYCEIIYQLATNKNEIISKNRKNVKKKAKFESRKVDKNNGEKSLKNKPINLDVTLKVSKEQSLQMEFIEKVIDKIYDQLLYHLKSIAHFASFPEIIFIFNSEFRKKIKSIPYVKGQTMLKQLLDKCEENSKFIMKHRDKEEDLYPKLENFRDNSQMKAFEQKLKDMKPPLVKFYEKWKEFKTKQEKTIDEQTRLRMAASQELSADKTNSMYQIDDDDDDPEIDDFEENDEGDEVELTAEQMKKIQAKIDLEEKSLEKSKEQKRKRKKKLKKKKSKKARGLNANLQLEGAFNLESSDDEQE